MFLPTLEMYRYRQISCGYAPWPPAGCVRSQNRIRSVGRRSVTAGRPSVRFGGAAGVAGERAFPQPLTERVRADPSQNAVGVASFAETCTSVRTTRNSVVATTERQLVAERAYAASRQQYR